MCNNKVPTLWIQPKLFQVWYRISKDVHDSLYTCRCSTVNYFVMYVVIKKNLLLISSSTMMSTKSCEFEPRVHHICSGWPTRRSENCRPQGRTRSSWFPASPAPARQRAPNIWSDTWCMWAPVKMPGSLTKLYRWFPDLPLFLFL